MLHIFRSIRIKLLETFNRRNLDISKIGPVVSFTFDDFPKSALYIGGDILRKYGAHGTYYVSIRLMDKINGLERYFSAKDLEILLENGHELGSHTFSHTSCKNLSFKEFHNDVIRGLKALNNIKNKELLLNFSYPYGHITFFAKQKIGKLFLSCRGIFPGINESPVDLNLLKSNKLYSWCFNLKTINHLFEENEKCRGWLIFYTHDVSENPSSFGCKPKELENVVKLAIKWKQNIFTVDRVILNAVEAKSKENYY